MKLYLSSSKRKLVSPLAQLALVSSLLIANSSFAQTAPPPNLGDETKGEPAMLTQKAKLTQKALKQKTKAESVEPRWLSLAEKMAKFIQLSYNTRMPLINTLKKLIQMAISNSNQMIWKKHRIYLNGS